MTYTIKAVAAKTGLSIYTLRFYDKQGLLPFVARNRSGYREFTDSDLHLLHTICCLKNTGMKIVDIRQYINYVMQGPKTIKQRQVLLKQHKQAILAKQQTIIDNLKEIDYKLKIYQSPAAFDFVAAEQAYAQSEKQANGLPDPYQAISSTQQ